MDNSALTFTRRSFLGSVLFIGGLMFAGCTSKSSLNGKILLSQWYHQYGEAGTHEAVLRYAAQYTAVNPHIAIKVVWVPGDYATKLATALLTPDGPDIYEDQLTAPMVDAGQAACVDDLYPAEVLADFEPACLSLNTVNGRLYGVQELIDTDLLYYRKSLLDAAGIAPPKTFEELIAAAATLTVPSGRKGIFLGNDGGITALINILPWTAGSDFLVDDRIVFDNARTAATYSALGRLNTSGSILFGAPTDYWDPSALIQGLTAMQWTGLWAYPALHRAFGDDLGAMPCPSFDEAGIPSTLSAGWASLINAQSPHVEEAKRYVKWLWIDNKAAQRDWCLSYGFHIPARQSIARDADVLSTGVPQVAVRSVREYGRFLPPLWNTAMTTALTDAVTNIVKLGHNAERELSQASWACRRELSRALE